MYENELERQITLLKNMQAEIAKESRAVREVLTLGDKLLQLTRECERFGSANKDKDSFQWWHEILDMLNDRNYLVAGTLPNRAWCRETDKRVFLILPVATVEDKDFIDSNSAFEEFMRLYFDRPVSIFFYIDE